MWVVLPCFSFCQSIMRTPKVFLTDHYVQQYSVMSCIMLLQSNITLVTSMWQWQCVASVHHTSMWPLSILRVCGQSIPYQHGAVEDNNCQHTQPNHCTLHSCTVLLLFMLKLFDANLIVPNITLLVWPEFEWFLFTTSALIIFFYNCP